jgi:hypothetical protein
MKEETLKQEISPQITVVLSLEKHNKSFYIIYV